MGHNSRFFVKYDKYKNEDNNDNINEGTIESIKEKQSSLNYQLIKDNKNNLLLFYNQTNSSDRCLYIINLEEQINNWCSNFNSFNKPKFIKINKFVLQSYSSKFTDKFICVKKFNKVINEKSKKVKKFRQNIFKKFNNCINMTFRGRSSIEWFQKNYPNVDSFFKCLDYENLRYCSSQVKNIRDHKFESLIYDIQNYLDTHFVPIEIFENPEYLGNKYIPYWKSDFSSKSYYFAGSVKAIKLDLDCEYPKIKLTPMILEYGFEGNLTNKTKEQDLFKKDIIKYDLVNAVLAHLNIKEDKRLKKVENYIKYIDIDNIAESIIINIKLVDRHCEDCYRHNCKNIFDVEFLQMLINKLI